MSGEGSREENYLVKLDREHVPRRVVLQLGLPTPNGAMSFCPECGTWVGNISFPVEAFEKIEERIPFDVLRMTLDGRPVPMERKRCRGCHKDYLWPDPR